MSATTPDTAAATSAGDNPAPLVPSTETGSAIANAGFAAAVHLAAFTKAVQHLARDFNVGLPITIPAPSAPQTPASAPATATATK